MTADCRIIIFAKAPVPGYAKTRLARVIGNEDAARPARKMLHHVAEAAVQAEVGPVEICCTPDTAHPAFEEAARQWGVALSLQEEGDLGTRMHRASCRALSGYSGVLIIGTDAPGIGVPQLQAAALALHSEQAVFIPASDGGYALVGLTHPMQEIFDDMTWSTSDVMAETRKRLQRIGLSWTELPVVHDIDEAEDLVHLPKEWLI
jgi:rSAM/selenodomain-associated transferase 1